MKVTVYPSRLQGSVQIPGSKSHSIRALLIAGMAKGESVIRNFLDSADTRACIRACRAFGAEVDNSIPNHIRVRGIGGERYTPVSAETEPIEIDVGNSGTTLYLSAGMAALFDRTVRFTGDEQIRRRPFAPLLQALSDLGAETRSVFDNGCAPAEIHGPLTGGETTVECPTSQYLSSLLLCTPLINNGIKVYESPTALSKSVIHIPLLFERPYVEISLRWLFKQGVSFYREGYRRFEIPGGQQYTAFQDAIPGDFSTASFFMCAAAVTGSEIILRGLQQDDAQGDKAVIDMLREMGCSIRTGVQNSPASPPVIIRGPDNTKNERLRAAEIDMNATPDALPIMAVTACFAEGETRLVNVPQARLKETDRIAVMREELSKMGADIRELDDGLIIRGRAAEKSGLQGTEVNGHGDHRVVMALSIAALQAEGPTTIQTAEAANITCPDFFSLLESLGCRVSYSRKPAIASRL